MATLQFPVGISQCILSMGIAHLEPSWNFSVTQGKVTLNLSWDNVNTGQICPGPPPGMKPIQVHCPKPQSYYRINSKNRNYTAPRFNKPQTVNRSDYDVQWRNNSNISESNDVSGYQKQLVIPVNDNSHVSDSLVSATGNTADDVTLNNDKISLAGSDTQVTGQPDSAESDGLNGELTTLFTDASGIISNNNSHYNANIIDHVSHNSDNIDHDHRIRYDDVVNEDDDDENNSSDYSAGIDMDIPKSDILSSDDESSSNAVDQCDQQLPNENVDFFSANGSDASKNTIPQSVLSNIDKHRDKFDEISTDTIVIESDTLEPDEHEKVNEEIPCDMYVLTENEDIVSLDQWKTKTISYLHQFEGFVPFLDGLMWEVVSPSQNDNRGLPDMQVFALNAMLGEIARRCPDCLWDKIFKYSTSIENVWNSIYSKYGVVNDT